MNMLCGMVAEAITKTTEALAAILKMNIEFEKRISELEEKHKDFKTKFRSITTDNGTEFLEYDKLITSIRGGKRFDVYYCHSYAAWEKGSNENHNRMIRRWLPKGTDFTNVSKKRIAAIQDWMNNYPRRVLGWAAPADFAA